MTENFAGNNEIKEILKSAAKSGRLPHAFIIEGEEGSGRTTLAKIISSIAVCSAEKDAVPCGECRHCKMVADGNNADVITYSPEGATFKIDTVRKITEAAYLMPIEAKMKVSILEDADKMNEPAQNALLKTLEEPPAFTVFILIVRNAASLLTTVRSRCVTLSLKNPDEEEAAAYIQLHTEYSEEQIAAAVSETRGNIGKALEILKGAVSKTHGDAKEILSGLSASDRYTVLKIFAGYEKDRPGFTALLSELQKQTAEMLKNAALGKREIMTAKKLARISETVREYADREKVHVGQPLSLPLTATALAADLFAE